MTTRQEKTQPMRLPRGRPSCYKDPVPAAWSMERATKLLIIRASFELGVQPGELIGAAVAREAKRRGVTA